MNFPTSTRINPWLGLLMAACLAVTGCANTGSSMTGSQALSIRA